MRPSTGVASWATIILAAGSCCCPVSPPQSLQEHLWTSRMCIIAILLVQDHCMPGRGVLALVASGFCLDVLVVPFLSHIKAGPCIAYSAFVCSCCVIWMKHACVGCGVWHVL
jgi:hypothetical protein